MAELLAKRDVGTDKQSMQHPFLG
ncbi:hypothetical protein V12B01_12875 [Vibrio splendidus 12B01]|nr:hypothetical protein V12B01_12875 [Vibrio splendidus 12B01]